MASGYLGHKRRGPPASGLGGEGLTRGPRSLTRGHSGPPSAASQRLLPTHRLDGTKRKLLAHFGHAPTCQPSAELCQFHAQGLRTTENPPESALLQCAVRSLHGCSGLLAQHVVYKLVLKSASTNCQSHTSVGIDTCTGRVHWYMVERLTGRTNPCSSHSCGLPVQTRFRGAFGVL